MPSTSIHTGLTICDNKRDGCSQLVSKQPTWDNISQLSLHHLTFFLEHMIPRWYCCISNSKGQHHGWHIGTGNLETDEDEFTEEKLIGSYGEKLCLPTYAPRGMSPPQNEAEFDKMIIWKKMLVGSSNRKNEMTDVRYRIETTDTYPGFLKLQCLGEPQSESLIIMIKGKALLSSSRMQTDVLQQNDTHTTGNTIVSLPVVHWPKEAGKWFNRERPSHWPHKQLRVEICEQSCHVVPVSHPLSRMSEVEWKFCFAMAEIKLADSITDAQRQCYLLFKLLVRDSIPQREVLGTYCLKTIFFWVLERIPPTEWQIGLGKCLLSLLDELLLCFTQRNIPHYFIPQNNLLDHIPQSNISIIQKRIMSIRKQPLQCLLDLTNKTGFIFLSDSIKLCDLFSRAITDSKVCHKSISKCCHIAQLEGLYGLCIACLSSGQFDGAIAISTEVANITYNMSGRLFECHDILQSISMQMKLHEAIIANEALLKISAENAAGFHKNLGVLYSHKAFNDSNDSTSNRWKDTAENHQLKARSIRPGKLEFDVDYSFFLYKAGRYEKAIDILAGMVHLERDSAEENSYFKRFAAFLDDHLKMEVKKGKMGRVNIPSIVAAHYQLINCYASNNQIIKAWKTMEDFTIVCNRYQNNQHVFSLLGGAFVVLGADDYALRAFRKAEQISNDEC